MRKMLLKMDRTFWVQGFRVKCLESRPPESNHPVVQSPNHPESKRPVVQSPSVQSSSVESSKVQESRVQTSIVQASRSCVQRPAFPVCLIEINIEAIQRVRHPRRGKWVDEKVTKSEQGGRSASRCVSFVCDNIIVNKSKKLFVPPR